MQCFHYKIKTDVKITLRAQIIVKCRRVGFQYYHPYFNVIHLLINLYSLLQKTIFDDGFVKLVKIQLLAQELQHLASAHHYSFLSLPIYAPPPTTFSDPLNIPNPVCVLEPLTFLFVIYVSCLSLLEVRILESVLFCFLIIN